MPPILTPEWISRRGAFKETITEILVADLGDLVNKSPHLIVSQVSQKHPLFSVKLTVLAATRER